jgi:L-rhamnose mutarotase
MAVHEGQAAEYERRHAEIWAEFRAMLIAHGVRSYSIYLDPETHDLFGYVECEDEARWIAIANADVCRRWWRHMREIMPANEDDSPISRQLREVFHLDASEAPASEIKSVDVRLREARRLAEDDLRAAHVDLAEPAGGQRRRARL